MGKKKVHFGFYDKLFLVMLNRAADIKCQLTLVKPQTVLSWQRNMIKRFWTFEHSPAKRGRKPVDAQVKNLILSMRNDNLLCEKRGAGQFSADWQESVSEELDESVAFYNGRRPHQGSGNRFRRQVNRGRQAVLSARVLFWVGRITSITDRRRKGWKKSPLRGAPGSDGFGTFTQNRQIPIVYVDAIALLACEFAYDTILHKQLHA